MKKDKQKTTIVTDNIRFSETDILDAYVKNKNATLESASEKLECTPDVLVSALSEFGHKIREEKERAEQKQISINFPIEHTEAEEAYNFIMSLIPVKRSRWVRECLYIGIKFTNKFGDNWIEEANDLADNKKTIQDELRQFKKDILDSLKNVRIIDNNGQEKEAKEIVPELDLGDLEF